MQPRELTFDAPLEAYQSEAEGLHDRLKSQNEEAAWRFKWWHPAFRGKSIRDVRAADLSLADARLVVARTYSFEEWSDLVEYTRLLSSDSSVARFERAVEAVVSGDASGLRGMLSQNPELAKARSTRSHRATLLHYVAANGVEGERQKTPPNAVEIARILLDAGAEPDALAHMYEAECTTMSMLVSSCHPARAGVQAVLAETLLDYGALLQGPGTNWQSALMTALSFGYLETAETLVRRGAPLTSLAAAAGLGREDEAAKLLPQADSKDRHLALALAAQHGHTDVVRLLLDAGEDPSRYNPDGAHSHSTPLHQAVWSNHKEVVRLLVERGARLDLRDTIYNGTPLGWAIHGGSEEIADYLRSQGETGK